MFGMPQAECMDFEDEGTVDKAGYRIPDRLRMKRQRQAYEEAEREDREDGRDNSGNHAGNREDIL